MVARFGASFASMLAGSATQAISHPRIRVAFHAGREPAGAGDRDQHGQLLSQSFAGTDPRHLHVRPHWGRGLRRDAVRAALIRVRDAGQARRRQPRASWSRLTDMRSFFCLTAAILIPVMRPHLRGAALAAGRATSPGYRVASSVRHIRRRRNPDRARSPPRARCNCVCRPAARAHLNSREPSNESVVCSPGSIRSGAPSARLAPANGRAGPARWSSAPPVTRLYRNPARANRAARRGRACARTASRVRRHAVARRQRARDAGGARPARLLAARPSSIGRRRWRRR